MKLTIEPTANLTEIPPEAGPVPCRVWQGRDEHGTPVIALVLAVSPQTHDPEINAAFAQELVLVPEPAAAEQGGGRA